MDKHNLNIHPHVRILFLAFSVAGTILVKEPEYLAGYYLVVLAPLLLLLKLGKSHYKLLLIGIIPIFLSFILIYIIVLKESDGGWDFIISKCVKILTITSSFQIAFAIPPHLLLPTFKKWGMKGNLLQTILGAFTVWADIGYRANQIIVARFARGFIGKRNIVNTSRQFPFVLVPMIIGVLRTANDRVSVWNQRNVPELIDMIETSNVKYPILFNMVILLSVLLLTGIGIYKLI